VTGTQGAVFTLLIAVAVPAYLISFSLLAGTLLGVVLVAVALTGRPRLTGPPVKLHIGKVELANFTPRTLVLLVGTVLVVAPVGIALFQRDAAASVSTQAPTSVTDVEKLPEDELKGMTFVSDTSVVDLRAVDVIPWYRRITFWDPRHSGPVRLTNTMRMRIDAPAAQATLTYATSGTMSARCLSHPFTVRRVKGHPEPSGERSEEAWQIVVPLAGIPIGQEFELINEVTYWDAFWRERESFTTYENAQDAVEQLSTVVLFPEKRPPKQLFRLVGIHGEAVSQPFTQTSREFAPPDKLTHYWQIVTAGGRSREAKTLAYTLQWDW
jgi:hypothetical protein